MEMTKRNGGELRPWRIVASAWGLAALLVVTSLGFETVASRCPSAPRQARLAGAVIPRHDPACAGIPTGECALGSSLEQAARRGNTF
jgi:hypothetical protein